MKLILSIKLLNIFCSAGVPGQPMIVAGSDTLSWTQPPSNGDPINGYRLYFTEVSGYVGRGGGREGGRGEGRRKRTTMII